MSTFPASARAVVIGCGQFVMDILRHGADVVVMGSVHRWRERGGQARPVEGIPAVAGHISVRRHRADLRQRAATHPTPR